MHVHYRAKGKELAILRPAKWEDLTDYHEQKWSRIRSDQRIFGQPGEYLHIVRLHKEDINICFIYFFIDALTQFGV